MDITFISDTHTFHREVSDTDNWLPGGDTIVCSGDICLRGEFEEALDFLNWFKELPYKHKIFTPGNHDICFDHEHVKCDLFRKSYHKQSGKYIEDIRNEIPPGITMLENSELVIDGVKFWGSPVTPWFHNWAFNVNRGEAIAQYWDKIPEDVDVIVVHGPPFGILDITLEGDFVGCEDLANRIKVVKPKIVSFGHIHESYGLTINDDIFYVNASVVNRRYWVTNKPQVLHIEQDKTVRLP